MGFWNKEHATVAEIERLTQLADERDRRLTEEQHTKERAGLEALTDEDAERILDELVAAFDDVKRYAHQSVDPEHEIEVHTNRLMPTVEDFRVTWLKIDRSHLSLSDAHLMYDGLRSALPKAAGLYASNAKRTSINAAVFGSNYMFSKEVVIIENRAMNLVVRFTVQLVALSHRQWTDSYLSSMPANKLSVPALKDVELHSVLQNFKALWVKADSCVLPEVDRYFVDEVAARYFPESWKIFQSFSGADEALSVRARSIFLEQVQLMGQRLAELTISAQTASLDAMEAHSSFLLAVTEGQRV